MVTPQPGYIGLTRIQGDVGFGIRVGQFLNKVGWKPWLWARLWKLSGFEHAFVFTGALQSQDGIVEAEPGGAVHVPLHYDAASIRWLVPPTPPIGVKTAVAAVGMIHTPYSFADYAALALLRLRIPSKHLRTYVADSGHLICSALVDRAAMLAGWRLFDDNRPVGDVTPEDLAQLCP